MSAAGYNRGTRQLSEQFDRESGFALLRAEMSALREEARRLRAENTKLLDRLHRAAIAFRVLEASRDQERAKAAESKAHWERHCRTVAKAFKRAAWRQMREERWKAVQRIQDMNQ